MADQVALALTFVGTVGLFSVYVDVNEAVRSYQDADVELWGIAAELEGNMVIFKIWYRIFGLLPPSASPRDVRSIIRTLHVISACTNEKLARYLKVLAPDSVDLEAHTTHLPVFSSRLARWNWSRGGKRSLTTGVETLSKQVDMLYRHIQCYRPITSTHPSFPLEDESIWLTDDQGTGRQLPLWLCRPVGGFVLCLMRCLKDRLGTLNQGSKARLLKGEFMILPEDGSKTESIYLHHAQPVILANNWEANALPGRRFRMVMRSETDMNVDDPLQVIGLETLHKTWNDMIKPVLDDILKLSGWEY